MGHADSQSHTPSAFPAGTGNEHNPHLQHNHSFLRGTLYMGPLTHTQKSVKEQVLKGQKGLASSLSE